MVTMMDRRTAWMSPVDATRAGHRGLRDSRRNISHSTCRTYRPATLSLRLDIHRPFAHVLLYCKANISLSWSKDQETNPCL